MKNGLLFWRYFFYIVSRLGEVPRYRAVTVLSLFAQENNILRIH